MTDSATAGGGLCLLALVAARHAAGGDGLERVCVAASEARRDLKMWVGLDTLEYLKRSGRAGAASAWIGSTLRVKPIVAVEREIVAVERVRTRRSDVRADARLRPPAAGSRAHAPGWCSTPSAWEEAESLAAECREIFGREPCFLTEVGPVLGVHTGPGLLGVGAISARFLDS